jgi:heme exporter protein B
VSKVLAVALKDLRSEARSKQVAPVMVAFSLSLVFLLTFALPPGSGDAPPPEPQAGAVAVREVIGPLVWTSLLLAAVIGFGRSASAEHEGGMIEALILSPVDPAALFAGKALANFLFLTLTEMAMIPAFALFAGVGITPLWPGILAVALAANLGLVAIGTLFGAAAQHSSSRSLILALLMFPVLLPLILAAAKLTSTLLLQGSFVGATHWFILMAVFDLVFTVIGAVTFEFVIQE